MEGLKNFSSLLAIINSIGKLFILKAKKSEELSLLFFCIAGICPFCLIISLLNHNLKTFKSNKDHFNNLSSSLLLKP